MKKITSVVLALTVTASLTACGTKAAPAENPANDAAQTPIAQVRNPYHFGSAEQVAADTGFLLTAPDGASDVQFASIDTDPATAQMSFTLDGVKYTYRMIADTETNDISGMYYTWTSTDTAEVDGRSADLHWIEGEQGHITWIDMVPGVHYDLSMDSAASKEALSDMASRLFVELQGNADGEADGSFAMDFSAALSEFCETIQPGTSGVSLRYAAFAAKLADLFTECAPAQDAVANAVEGFVETLDETHLQQFPVQLNSVLTVFRELTGERGGDLLSACGYVPQHAWDADTLEPLFRAMYMSAPWEAVYTDIVAQYASAVRDGYDRQQMRDIALNDLAADVGDTPLDTLGYLIGDLDGDGIQELVIGTISDNDFFGKLILDLYTLDETGTPRLLFRSGERNRLYSAGSNVFANVGSSGAADSVSTTLELKDGELIDLQKELPTEYYSQLDLTPLSERP